MHLTVGYLATPTGDDGVALAGALATAAIPTRPGDDNPLPFALTLASAANLPIRMVSLCWWSARVGLLHHDESSWGPQQLVFWQVPMRR